jgi:hypothetical protein
MWKGLEYLALPSYKNGTKNSSRKEIPMKTTTLTRTPDEGISILELTPYQLKLGIEWNELSDKYTETLIKKYKFPNSDTVVAFRKARELFTLTDTQLRKECNNDSSCIRAAIIGRK